VEVVAPDEEATDRLRAALERHAALTGSDVAAEALDRPLTTHFVHVRPKAKVVPSELHHEVTARPRR
jgi:hypothetical protein